MDKSKTIILVPVSGAIEPETDTALRELERQGYTVWRDYRHSAIDQGRSRMATEALAQGYDELIWIDADVSFHPEAVEQLRAANLPIVAGLYPLKGFPALVAHFLPETKEIKMGLGGGLIEIKYAGTGFLYTHRCVYEAVKRTFELPLCNARSGCDTIPYFRPLLVEDTGSEDKDVWYMGEDYSFLERANRCGFKVYADTSIRLGHIGKFSYTWESLQSAKKQFDSVNICVEGHNSATSYNSQLATKGDLFK